MANMKRVQPKMEELKAKFGDDRMGLQQAMMQLYKEEKINPIAGCWPIALQTPVFFALYKVIYITIEMRHAPFFGWIQDLSAPDPTTIVNLFGLLPFEAPLSLHARRMAADNGCDDVRADAHEPDAARPNASDDLQLDAAGLYLHAGKLPGRPRHLLGLEQYTLRYSAGGNHAPPRCEDRALRQSQGLVPAKTGAIEVNEEASASAGLFLFGNLFSMRADRQPLVDKIMRNLKSLMRNGLGRAGKAE